MKFGTINGNANAAILSGIALDMTESFFHRINAARAVRIRHVMVLADPDGHSFVTMIPGTEHQNEFVLDKFAGYGIEFAAGIVPTIGENQNESV